MPKLLSQSKYEELESNSALQIKDQKERRAKSEEKWSTESLSQLHQLSLVKSPPLHFLLFRRGLESLDLTWFGLLRGFEKASVRK